MSNYNDELEKPGWMPIDEKIGLACWYERGTDWTCTKCYLHCYHNSSNKNFVVIASNFCNHLDKESLLNPNNWELNEDCEEYASLFKESEILEWKTTDEKIPAILFIYDDNSLDNEYIKSQFLGDYGWPEIGELSRIVYCTKNNINQNIEDFISSGEYLNYNDILIASNDISNELADKIDNLNYDGFILFSNSPECMCLKQYKWCIIDPNKSKSLMYDDYVDDKYEWGTEYRSMLDAINAIVTGQLDGRGEYSNNLKVMNALYEKWGTDEFLSYLYRYDEDDENIELDEVIYDGFVRECKRLYEVHEIDDFSDIEGKRKTESKRIDSAKQKLNEVLENKKADFAKDDITICLYALDLMKDTFHESDLNDDIEYVESELYDAGIIYGDE